MLGGSFLGKEFYAALAYDTEGYSKSFNTISPREQQYFVQRPER